MAAMAQVHIPISNDHFLSMFRFAKIIYQLKYNVEYIRSFQDNLPESARIQPECPSVLMGFDFHLTDTEPKLIEINNNAAGLCSWKTNVWLPQPDIPQLCGTLEDRLQKMFPPSWKSIAILDSAIESQFFYYEMKAYAGLMRKAGRKVVLVSPHSIEINTDHSLSVKGAKIDGIYNRHTDFYLESKEMDHIRKAYLTGKVGLSPHPRSYAFMADKRRMVDWRREGFLETIGLSEDAIELLFSVLPESLMLSDFNVDEIWKLRKKYVFKPGTSHGGKGVLMGKSVRQKRFKQMIVQAENFVVQEYIPAPWLEVNNERFKYDVRLYMCGDTLIGLAARLFQGNMTSFKHPDSGFYPVSIRQGC